MDFLGNTLVQLLVGLFGTWQTAKKEGEAQVAIEQQLQEILTVLESNATEVQRMHEEGTAEEIEFAEMTREFMNAESDDAREGIIGTYEEKFGAVLRDYGIWDAELKELSQQRSGALLARVGRVAQDVTDYAEGRVPDVMSPWRRTAQTVRQGYANLLNEAMGLLEGAGEQAREDIQETFAGLVGEARGHLTERGLMSTSVWETTQRAITEDESAELRRLDEQLRGEKLNVLMGLTGEALSAEERLGLTEAQLTGSLSGDLLTTMAQMGMWVPQMEAALTSEDLARRERTGGLGFQLQGQYATGLTGLMSDIDFQNLAMNLALLQGQAGIMGRHTQNILPFYRQPALDIANVLAGVTHEYPESDWVNNYWSTIMQNQAFQPEVQTDWWSPTITGATTLTSSAVLANVLGGGGGGMAAFKAFVACVDASAFVETPDGDLYLWMVDVGDEVKGSDGKFHKVLVKDCGQPHTERADDYITIWTGHGRIRLTKDHPICGKPAGEWKLGEPIEVHGIADKILGIAACEPITSGDLKLEGVDGYMAEGFQITSVLTEES